MGDAVTPDNLARPPVLVWLEVRGFRAFGTEPRRMDFDSGLIVVHARNSQGKSSLAEALEFLLTGRSSRRDLLGGAKAEYHESLRNVHLPAGDDGVWVAAGLRSDDGQIHEVRRELVTDFAQGTECDSQLFVDNIEQADLADFSLSPAVGSSLGAPVLLQHTLRHVLSTQPKERVGYFKSLLALTDLDAFRERVAEARRRCAAASPSTAGHALTALTRTPFSDVADQLCLPLAPSQQVAAQLVDEALLTAGTQALGTRPDDIATLVLNLQAAVARQREAMFPLSAFTGGPPPADRIPLDLTPYSSALAQADRELVALAPIFTAVLAVPAFNPANGPADCPVCATPHALTPERLGILQNELRRGAAVQSAARVVVNDLRVEIDALVRTCSQAEGAVPAAASWTSQQAEMARKQMVDLELDETLLTAAGSTAVQAEVAMKTVVFAAKILESSLRSDLHNVERRVDVDVSLRAAEYQTLNEALVKLRHAQSNSNAAAAALQMSLEPIVSIRTATAGLGELLQAAQLADALATEVRLTAARQLADKRLADVEKVLAAAAAAVLDSRFRQMSESITRWWLTIRPEELVAFAGVQRRAGGATFVNLMASLRISDAAPAVQRHALGVFSDSQLNALGLSTFLARTELLGSPIVVLDDPIPGSDSDHRFTFAQNTIDALVSAGIQVILTTYDSRLAQLAAGQQASRAPRTYELNLIDQVAGTEPTPTSDVFAQLMLEAEEKLNVPTTAGRRAACTNYRIAAERLAKQIVATGRTATVTATSIADVEKEAKMLGKLVPLVKGFALNDTERGHWTNFATVLNPGNHDDDVPSNADLKQIRNNLKRISKLQHQHYSGGLVK